MIGKVDKCQLGLYSLMPKSKKTKDAPHYALADVKALIASGSVDIWSNALTSADQDFGWDSADILNALAKLNEGDFYKRDVSPKNRFLVMDFYKATVMNERIYTHFYIDDKLERLVVQSFKQE